jgi:hypothetical protein
MRYMVCINDNERVANGDESTWDDTLDEIRELLRSGYFEVEYMDEARDNE